MKHLFVSLGILLQATQAVAGWQITTVDSNGNPGQYSTIAIDSGDNPRISYYEPDSKVIRYAKWTGAAWTIETAVNDGGGVYTSMALDASGYPAIFYNRQIGAAWEMRQAKWTGAAWSLSTVLGNSYDRAYTSVALDADGNPYVANQNAGLFLTRWNGSAWVTETADAAAGAGAYNSILRDSAGNLHISYSASGDLKYAKKSGSTWTTQTVDSVGTVGSYTSLALDATGYPHISYYDETNTALKYASWTGSAWVVETVDSTGDVGSYTSLKIDANGYPHISYYDETNTALKYAKWTGAYWLKQTIDSAGNVGTFTSLALDSSGNPHIACFDATNGAVKYAKLTGNPTLSWTGEANYATDGINPESGTRATSFNFRVQYSDAEDDAPATGFPKLHIKKTGIEISGSPYSMDFVSSTTYIAGAIYSYSKSFDSLGSDYTYYFEGMDSYGAPAGGAAVSTLDSPDIANIVPELLWTGEANYVADGLHPEAAGHNDTYVFRVKYSDADNDPPAIGYPQLHIKKNGVEITNSPFVMNYVSGSNAAGALYTYSKILTSTGTDYTYYFVAQDTYNAVAVGVGTATIDSPDVGDTVPSLSWTGETNYSASGLVPVIGNIATSFIYRVKYSDIDNDAPTIGYPKLHIKKGGAEIAGSPFAMTYVSGAYDSGAIYTYAQTLLLGTDYTYYFEAQNAFATATGVPLTPIDAPDVDTAPTLDWTGEANYTADGIHPENGVASTSIEYRVKYVDGESDAPTAGYPKVHIKKGGSEISGSPFTMSYVSGAYNTGAIYTYSRTLALGTDYTYYFEAQDVNTNVATGVPLTSVDAPDIKNAPTLAWAGVLNYSADGLNPETGDVTANYVYRVKYTDADNDAPASGYPRLHITKGGVAIAGSPFTMSLLSGTYSSGATYSFTKTLGAGADYAYYFEAQDSDTNVASGAPLTTLDAPDVAEVAQEDHKTTIGDNFFNPKTGGTSKIKFDVPTPGRVSLKVYNLAGKFIRTIFEGDVTTGNNQKDWDGKDDSGRYVVPGVYFLHYVYPGGKEVRKIGVRK